MNLNLFSSLNLEQKIDFFVQCQKLLIQYHSDSSFIIRANNLQKSINSFVTHIQDYKGYYYTDANLCILFNYIYVQEPINLNETLRENAYKEPAPNYNGISIDFVVMKDISCSLEFIRAQDAPQIKYILFVTGGKIKVHKKDDLLKKLPLRSKNNNSGT